MNRINIFLSDQQLKAFKQLQKKTGLSRAELIRRIIDEYLEKQRKEGFVIIHDLPEVRQSHTFGQRSETLPPFKTSCDRKS